MNYKTEIVGWVIEHEIRGAVQQNTNKLVSGEAWYVPWNVFWGEARSRIWSVVGNQVEWTIIDVIDLEKSEDNHEK